MIEPLPTSWRDLQDRVAQILTECGIDTAVEKQVELARGSVNIDVWAHDALSVPPQTYIVECKHWSNPVPQTVVHAFRTVVGDCGANWGAIVSSNGFQSGAYTAAQYSNVRLHTWNEFLALFELTWFDRYFCPKVTEVTDPLIEYTEPINSRVFRKANLLPKAQFEEFKRLRETHSPFAKMCLMMGARATRSLRLIHDRSASVKPSILLRLSMQRDDINALEYLPNSILDADSHRALLAAITAEAETVIASFDQVFGERA